MTKDELKPCPCGKTPKELCITDGNQGGKWAYVYGDCCNDWMIEFRTDYHPIDSPKCMSNAVFTWNGAPRADQPQDSKATEHLTASQMFPRGYLDNCDWCAGMGCERCAVPQPSKIQESEIGIPTSGEREVKLTRPDCFNFAMNFLSDPGAPELIAYIESLEKALQARGQSVPTGFKIVPIEPTEEMLDAVKVSGSKVYESIVYAAMLAAAPSPKE